MNVGDLVRFNSNRTAVGIITRKWDEAPLIRRCCYYSIEWSTEESAYWKVCSTRDIVLIS